VSFDVSGRIYFGNNFHVRVVYGQVRRCYLLGLVRVRIRVGFVYRHAKKPSATEGPHILHQSPCRLQFSGIVGTLESLVYFFRYRQAQRDLCCRIKSGWLQSLTTACDVA